MDMQTDQASSYVVIINEINRLFTQGRIQVRECRFDEAEDTFREAFAIAHGHGGRNPYGTSPFLDCLASVYEGRGQFEVAEELRMAAIAAAREEGANPQIWENNLALFYIRQRCLDQAEAIILEHLDQPDMRHGSAECDRAHKETNLARLREAQERYDEAERLHLNAIQLMEGSLGLEHPALGIPLGAYSMYLERRGRNNDAAAVSKRAESIKENYLTNYKPERGKCPPMMYLKD